VSTEALLFTPQIHESVWPWNKMESVSLKFGGVGGSLVGSKA
jgi:hypothetical protein